MCNASASPDLAWTRVDAPVAGPSGAAAKSHAASLSPLEGLSLGYLRSLLLHEHWRHHHCRTATQRWYWQHHQRDAAMASATPLAATAAPRRSDGPSATPPPRRRDGMDDTTIGATTLPLPHRDATMLVSRSCARAFLVGRFVLFYVRHDAAMESATPPLARRRYPTAVHPSDPRNEPGTMTPPSTPTPLPIPTGTNPSSSDPCDDSDTSVNTNDTSYSSHSQQR
ncbi:hypothetical protein HD554DRAFT_2328181 [Boletus coccyginus]|nr:hypothetical protein HD554DRAFT_2328181 [Boletus coccyginus]